MRTPTPLRVPLAALATVLVAAACSTGTPTSGPPAATPSSPAPLSARPLSTPPSAPGRTRTTASTGATRAVAVYYLRDIGRGPRLYREFHPRTATSSTEGSPGESAVRDAVDAMLHESPYDPDYTSLWPRDTQVRAVGVTTETASVDLSAAARRGNAGSPFEAMSLQQLVHTVTAAAPAVKRVRLLVEGAPVESLWGHVALGTRSLARTSQVDALAPVWLESPVYGATTGRTVRLAGQASVFEGTVSWEVRRDRSVVRRGFTTATLGGPGRGTFETSVTLPPGTYVARAFESSAENGQPLFVDDKVFTVR